MASSKKKQLRKFFMIDNLLIERGILCEWCWERTWTDKHHAIMRRDNRFPEFDVPENLLCACHTCHDSGVLDTNEVSILFYFVQKARGYDMDTWLLNLPCKIKPSFAKYHFDLSPERVGEEPLSLLIKELRLEAL